MSREEAPCLPDAAKGERLGVLYVLALNIGMRQGDLLALKWDDVDLEGGALRVRHTLTKAGKVYATREPKTSNSRFTATQWDAETCSKARKQIAHRRYNKES